MLTAMNIPALILSLVFLTQTVQAQEPKKIKIGYPAISYNQIHIWVAKDAGLFRKYGLDTEIVFFRGGQMATQALVAGDPPIVNIGTVVQAGLQGHDVVLIGSSENAYNYSVVARPGTTRIEQLKGKRLGVSGFGSASHNASLILLKKFNLEPSKDVALVVAGPTSDRLSAVDAGRIDATLLTPSELPRSRKQGLVEVYDWPISASKFRGTALRPRDHLSKASATRCWARSKAMSRQFTTSIAIVRRRARSSRNICA